MEQRPGERRRGINYHSHNTITDTICASSTILHNIPIPPITRIIGLTTLPTYPNTCMYTNERDPLEMSQGTPLTCHKHARLYPMIPLYHRAQLASQ